MDAQRQAAAQKKVQGLIQTANDPAASEHERNNAARAACALIPRAELLIAKPDDYVTFVAAPAPQAPVAQTPSSPQAAAPAGRRRRRTIDVAADAVVTTVDAAGRIVSSVKGLQDTLRGR